MKPKLGVVSKWENRMGYSPQEIKYISYFKKKKLFHFQISLNEIKKFNKFNEHKLQIVIVKHIYKFKSRYFIIENKGITKLQTLFRNYKKKKNFFCALKLNNLHKELLSFWMSPPIKTIPLLKLGGIFYREKAQFYTNRF